MMKEVEKYKVMIYNVFPMRNDIRYNNISSFFIYTKAMKIKYIIY